MKRFKKYFGKVLLITILTVVGITSNFYAYSKLSAEDRWESGTVIAKDIGMTMSKYPRQYWVISFKYDNNVLGTRDIHVTYSTYAKLNPGDRASFAVSQQEYDRHGPHSVRNELITISAVLFAGGLDLLLAALLLMVIGMGIEKLWKGEY